jgi:hypothetical protein
MAAKDTVSFQITDREFVVAECERCGAKWLIETDEWRGLREWMMESDVGWDLVRDPCEDCQIVDSNPGKTLMFRIPTKTELKTMILDEKVPPLDGRPNHQRDEARRLRNRR